MASPPVTVSMARLRSKPHELRDEVSRAFGSEPGCLGVIIVSDLPPDFPPLREKLFRSSHKFTSLPEAVREKYARENVQYMFGWSHGKEIMNGRPDTLKGSYYANPLSDLPDVSDEKRAAHPEYYHGNVWPEEDGLEEFKSTFKAYVVSHDLQTLIMLLRLIQRLGEFIFEVGLALARACEAFVAPNLSDVPESKGVERLLTGSRCHKARLLHYFPQSSIPDSADALCGTHLDHSLLTGLTSALYLDASSSPAEVVPSPSKEAGLWIFPRGTSPSSGQGGAVKVNIPADCLAFQIGEAMEVLTGGRLAATPHYVSGVMGERGGRDSTGIGSISRETFAFFLQPDVDNFISPTETFGQFTKRILGTHYAPLPQEAET